MIAAAARELPALTEGEFERFRELIHREAGISLGDTKHALLIGRLARRLRELGLSSFTAYLRVVTEDDRELVRMLDCIATNETHFFREPRQFELLGGRICDEWLAGAVAGARPRELRVWSAACSTGEEPFSLAMVLHNRLASDRWKIAIMASDLSTRALDRAHGAVWPIEKARSIPEALRRAYLLRGIGPRVGHVKAAPEVRELVTFQRANLARPEETLRGPFDAIFCRNVLIYFDVALRVQVLARLRDELAPGGYLFLGHAESLSGTSLALQSVMPGVYRRAERARTPEAPEAR